VFSKFEVTIFCSDVTPAKYIACAARHSKCRIHERNGRHTHGITSGEGNSHGDVHTPKEDGLYALHLQNKNTNQSRDVIGGLSATFVIMGKLFFKKDISIPNQMHKLKAIL